MKKGFFDAPSGGRKSKASESGTGSKTAASSAETAVSEPSPAATTQKQVSATIQKPLSCGAWWEHSKSPSAPLRSETPRIPTEIRAAKPGSGAAISKPAPWKFFRSGQLFTSPTPVTELQPTCVRVAARNPAAVTSSSTSTASQDQQVDGGSSSTALLSPAEGGLDTHTVTLMTQITEPKALKSRHSASQLDLQEENSAPWPGCYSIAHSTYVDASDDGSPLAGPFPRSTTTGSAAVPSVPSSYKSPRASQKLLDTSGLGTSSSLLAASAPSPENSAVVSVIPHAGINGPQSAQPTLLADIALQTTWKPAACLPTCLPAAASSSASYRPTHTVREHANASSTPCAALPAVAPGLDPEFNGANFAPQQLLPNQSSSLDSSSNLDQKTSGTEEVEEGAATADSGLPDFTSATTSMSLIASPGIPQTSPQMNTTVTALGSAVTIESLSLVSGFCLPGLGVHTYIHLLEP